MQLLYSQSQKVRALPLYSPLALVRPAGVTAICMRCACSAVPLCEPEVSCGVWSAALWCWRRCGRDAASSGTARMQLLHLPSRSFELCPIFVAVAVASVLWSHSSLHAQCARRRRDLCSRDLAVCPMCSAMAFVAMCWYCSSLHVHMQLLGMMHLLASCLMYKA